MTGTPFRFGVVVSRFNEEITEALLTSCRRRLMEAGVPEASIETVKVPGGCEIPWAAQQLAATGRFDAVICLGCILPGQTSQNEHIARSVFDQLQRVSVATGVPCINEVLTPRTWKQAQARTKGELDRGLEAADAALAMAALRRELGSRR